MSSQLRRRARQATSFQRQRNKVQSHNNVLITKTLDCLSVDPESSALSLEQKKKINEGKMEESARTQKLALEIAAHIDAIGSEKTKPQTG